MAYISGAALPAAADLATEAGCPFCRAKRGSDEDGLVVARGLTVFAVLNLYPYNPGHLMVLPYRHIADYPELDPAENVEFAQFSQQTGKVEGFPAEFNLTILSRPLVGETIPGQFDAVEIRVMQIDCFMGAMIRSAIDRPAPIQKPFESRCQIPAGWVENREVI